MNGKVIPTLAIVAVGLISFYCPSDAQGQSGDDGTSELTMEQFNALPEEEQKKYPVLEMVQLMEDDSFTVQMAVVMIEYSLCELKYYLHFPTGESNENQTKAIREFQTDIGAKPSGVMTVGQFFELQEKFEGLRVEPVYPPPGGPRVVYGVGYATVEGTWSFEGNARPIQASKISCYKDLGSCFEALAFVDRGYPVQMDAQMLDIDLQVWHVIHWDTESIEAKNDAAACAAYNLIINLRTKSAFQIRRGKGCEGIAESPMMIQLVDGFKVGFEEGTKRKQASGELMSKRYQAALKKFMGDGFVAGN